MLTKKIIKKEKFNFDLAIHLIKKLGYPVFNEQMEKDEVENNPSFFIYVDDGDSRTAGVYKQYQKEFTLSFVTKEGKKIDEIELAEQLRGTGLQFVNSQTDLGKVANTGQEVKMVTLTFERLVVVC